MLGRRQCRHVVGDHDDRVDAVVLADHRLIDEVEIAVLGGFLETTVENDVDRLPEEGLAGAANPIENLDEVLSLQLGQSLTNRVGRRHRGRQSTRDTRIGQLEDVRRARAAPRPRRGRG